MGWTFGPARYWKNGKVDRKAECDRVLTWARTEPTKGYDGKIYPPSHSVVLKSAMVGSTYYAAVKRETEGQEPCVWAAVFLTKGRDKWSGSDWGYKDMSEDMEPYYYDCPASILALLTPATSEGAKKWREECRKRIAEKSEKRKAIKANGGTLPPPMTPMGVHYEYLKSKRWHIVTSAEYQASSGYRGIRYSNRRGVTAEVAVQMFLRNHGTEAQKREYVEKGGVLDGAAA